MLKMFKKEYYLDHEKIVVESIKEKLLVNSNDFSANWLYKHRIQDSILSKNGKIQVSVLTYNILSPLLIELSKKDKKIFKELIAPIYMRSLKQVLELEQ